MWYLVFYPSIDVPYLVLTIDLLSFHVCQMDNYCNLKHQVRNGIPVVKCYLISLVLVRVFRRSLSF